MADVNKHRSSNAYLLAGVTSTHSDRAPPNFAWPVPDVHSRQIDYTNNVHTEYRDNFHEWRPEDQVKQ